MRKYSSVAHLIISLLIFSISSFASAQTKAPSQTTRKASAAQAKLSEAEIAEARTLLSSLGYWLDVNANGLDASLRHALIAFQKIEERKRTGVLTIEELEALRTAEKPQAREWGYTHVEVDLRLQVLMIVDCCSPDLKILPISSGSGEWFTEGGRTRQAVTPVGRFKVIRQIKGWRKSPLGLLYYPSYFYGGVAIHGNPSVPAYPASHGCIRIPMFAAKEFSELAAVGTDIIVYGDPTASQP